MYLLRPLAIYRIYLMICLCRTAFKLKVIGCNVMFLAARSKQLLHGPMCNSLTTSLIYNRNRSGPKTLPWTTRYIVRPILSDNDEPTLVCCVHLFKKLSIHLSKLSAMPHAVNLTNNFSRLTQSNALL